MAYAEYFTVKNLFTITERFFARWLVESKSIDYGNDVMVEQFAFLFLLGAIFRETSTKINVKISEIDVIVAWSILLSTIEMT